MEILLKNLQKWLQRNKVDDLTSQKDTIYKKSEGHWYQKSSGPTKPTYVFCRNDKHWSDQCKTVKRLADRKKFFSEKNLCFNYGRTGHRRTNVEAAVAEGVMPNITEACVIKMKTTNRTIQSFLDLAEYVSEEKSLAAIIPVNIDGHTMYPYLDVPVRAWSKSNAS